MSRDKHYQKLLNSKRWAEVKRFVWQRADGLCERCRREGLIRAGVDCHHKTPVESAKTEQEMERLAYDVNNIELLCIPCHIKTHQEMHSHRKEKVKENKARARQRFLEANDPNYQSNAMPTAAATGDKYERSMSGDSTLADKVCQGPVPNDIAMAAERDDRETKE